jgi:hypothetical protein
VLLDFDSNWVIDGNVDGIWHILNHRYWDVFLDGIRLWHMDLHFDWHRFVNVHWHRAVVWDMHGHGDLLNDLIWDWLVYWDSYWLLNMDRHWVVDGHMDWVVNLQKRKMFDYILSLEDIGEHLLQRCQVIFRKSMDSPI